MNHLLGLLLGVLLLVNVAHASTDDASDPSSKNLANLQYYNHIGEVLFEGTFNSAIHAGSFGSDRSFQGTDLFLSYGAFLEGLRFSVEADDSVTTYYTGSRTTSYTGFSNPYFGASYRVIDANPSGFSLNTGVTFSPSTGTRTNATNGQAGSNSRGAAALNLSATAFWTQALNEISLQALWFHQFSGSGYNPPNAETYSLNSLSEFQITLTDRFHLSPKFFMEGSVRAVFSESSTYTYPNGSGTLENYPFNVVPTLELGYLHSKQFLITAFLSAQSYTEISSSIVDATGSNSVENKVYSTNWGLRATVEF